MSFSEWALLHVTGIFVMKLRNIVALFFAGFGVISFSSLAVAATITYKWTLSLDAYSVTGEFGGLIDGIQNQSVSAASITQSNLGGVGILTIDGADINRDFFVFEGQVLDGNLKFKSIGDGTVDSPETEFELKWKDGELKTAKFKSDNGEKADNVALDFKDNGVIFSLSQQSVFFGEDKDFAESLIYHSDQVSSVPLPSGLPMLLLGITGLAILRSRQIT